jgi:hypothetical protein
MRRQQLIVREGIRVRRGVRSLLYKPLKSIVNPHLHASPTPRTSCPLRLNVDTRYGNHFQNKPHMGLPKLKVLRQNPSAGTAPPRENSARDKVTQRMTNSWCYLSLHRGDPTYSSFLSESRPGSFHHTLPPPPPLAGRHRATWVLLTGTTWEQCVKPLGSDLMERYICPCWLSPANGDPCSTQILTGSTVLVSTR